MLKWLASLIRRIVGRVKKNMVAILTGLIGVFFPIGAAFFILSFQEENTGKSLPYLILGIMFWIGGIYIWRELKKAYNDERKIENSKFIAQLQELKGVRSDMKDSINELVNEIRLDREERKRGGMENGEQNNKSKQ